MGYLVTHSAVRLYPSGTSADRWRVANLETCVEYRCGRLATMLLVAFADGDTNSAVSREFADRYNFELQSIETAIDCLEELGLLVEPDNATHRRAQVLLSAWSAWGWVDAADYHLATLNYPFVDYSRDGRDIDFKRMVSYVRDAPDMERTKSYSSVVSKWQVPPTPKALSTLNELFAHLWVNEYDLTVCDRSKMGILMSSVFGKLRERRLADDRSLMADAIGKTSPSGGSRHPTEAYLFAWNVRDLPKGIYHFNVTDSSLDQIAKFDVTESQRHLLFSGPLRASFAVDAVIVMTSKFDRSMYRYREPRSFRAIYMDVGHLCGTLDIVAKSLQLNCLVQHGLDDEAVGAALGLDPLVEGVIYGAAVGGQQGHRND
ncbi:SagB/ThcOx family dehydrogenase [Mesorhizobium sp. M1A.F.Ca.IN.022.06.1.1]|uniref:SagB/ThcOx family dehydrogenase n=1 Tax=Mesorhizobium sp. M1A.F.Ca.IN.022.06.1.1 TaxID=2493680 RepID=UPI000F764F74|nr:SagB/ThcOx family dehydrogenase [Mesorhizobium sp. M1A.F.Ca.IN.022.06.1.1]AZO59681.1 SagB/ThcOx family dehydrogenase [Mesorhizobium sp. M1A.F.Ca.IN.022.06.1.1]